MSEGDSSSNFKLDVRIFRNVIQLVISALSGHPEFSFRIVPLIAEKVTLYDRKRHLIVFLNTVFLSYTYLSNRRNLTMMVYMIRSTRIVKIKQVRFLIFHLGTSFFGRRTATACTSIFVYLPLVHENWFLENMIITCKEYQF